MSKQEVIRKAYGEYWERVKDKVDKNGWVTTDDLLDICLNPRRFAPYEVNDADFISAYRPKSLQGIETNNGWIKIESEAHLPYYSINNRNKNIHYYGYDSFKDKILWNTLTLFELHSLFQQGKITHFQPIAKPLKPIY